MVKQIAVVGSEKKYLTTQQKIQVEFVILDLLRKEGIPFGLNWTDHILLVSGGCDGVDTIAEKIADYWYIKKDIHPAPAKQWYDKTEIIYETPRGNYEKTLKGYRTRNIEIAKICDVLYCIDPKWRGENTGGQWTMRYAQKLGKEVHLIEI